MHVHLYDVENAQLIEAFSGVQGWHVLFSNVLMSSVHPHSRAWAAYRDVQNRMQLCRRTSLL
jgi:hypothetical protein